MTQMNPLTRSILPILGALFTFAAAHAAGTRCEPHVGYAGLARVSAILRAADVEPTIVLTEIRKRTLVSSNADGEQWRVVLRIKANLGRVIEAEEMLHFEPTKCESTSIGSTIHEI